MYDLSIVIHTYVCYYMSVRRQNNIRQSDTGMVDKSGSDKGRVRVLRDRYLKSPRRCRDQREGDIDMTNKMIDNRVKKLKDLNDQIKALEDQAAALRDELTKEIESRDAEEIRTDNFLVKWTKVITNRFDSKSFKSELPSLYHSYLKATESRRFSIA